MDWISKIQKIEFGSMSVSYTDSVLSTIWQSSERVNRNQRNIVPIIDNFVSQFISDEKYAAQINPYD